MKKEDWIRKLTSRKFWMAVANFVCNVILFFQSPSGSSERVTALILSFGGFIAYIVAEGIVDAAREHGDNIYVSDALEEEIE